MSIIIRYQGINSSAALFQKDVEGAVSIEILNTFSKGVVFWVFVIDVSAGLYNRLVVSRGSCNCGKAFSSSNVRNDYFTI